jgi:intergrase/recombinase
MRNMWLELFHPGGLQKNSARRCVLSFCQTSIVVLGPCRKPQVNTLSTGNKPAMSNKRVTTIEWSKLDDETRDAIRQYKKPNGSQKLWTKAERRLLRSCVKQGLSWKRIAEELSRTVGSCRLKYSRGKHV